MSGGVGGASGYAMSGCLLAGRLILLLMIPGGVTVGSEFLEPPSCPRCIGPVSPPDSKSASFLKLTIGLWEPHLEASVDPVNFVRVAVVLNKIQDHVILQGITPKADDLSSVVEVVVIIVAWSSFIYLIVVVDGNPVAVIDEVASGHVEDDDGDRERWCYSCNYFNLCFFL